nr:alpha-1,3-mannosyl-glycoprotein 4-beta-N-acetylglucosaminyltransferase-like protein MGAT4D [Marmota flaviventris]
MRTKQVNLLISFVAVTLFSFSCFCISRLTQTYNQLISCRNHVLEFRETMLHLKNKTENNRQELIKALNQMKYEITLRDNESRSLDEKTVTPSENETASNRFEALKFFFPHLRKVARVYPDVIIGKGKRDVTFALGISTVNRGAHSYLKQTLNSIMTRMTPSEEKDSVVIVSIADSNEDYLKSVVDMIMKRFRRQVKSGSLEVISVPAFLYPDRLHTQRPTVSERKSWHMKQVLDFCILMLYAQSKAMYYLQLEDDIIARKMYFTKMTDFLHNITSNNWFYIQFSVLGFIGKLFRTEDLPGFVHFFLMFYKDKPIDLLLETIFQVKMCDPAENFKECSKRQKHILLQHKPSLFQHVGIHSSLPGKEQYYKRCRRPGSAVSEPRGASPGGHALLRAQGPRAVERPAAGERSTRLGPRPPRRRTPLAHARLAAAAGRLPAGFVWGDAETE